MRHLAIMAAGVVYLGIIGGAYAGPASPALRNDIGLQVQLVQDKPQNSETLKHKVKRIWRNLTGYKFDVACPAFPIVLTRTTCTATGKNREEARAKCQSQNAFCQVADKR